MLTIRNHKHKLVSRLMINTCSSFFTHMYEWGRDTHRIISIQWVASMSAAAGNGEIDNVRIIESSSQRSILSSVVIQCRVLQLEYKKTMKSKHTLCFL